VEAVKPTTWPPTDEEIMSGREYHHISDIPPPISTNVQLLKLRMQVLQNQGKGGLRIRQVRSPKGQWDEYYFFRLNEETRQAMDRALAYSDEAIF
jgi:hypothetical protein